MSVFEFFAVEQLTRAGLLPADESLAGWYVDWGGSYRGKVVAPAAWSAVEVLAALNEATAPLGENVMKGRLFSPVRLG